MVGFSNRTNKFPVLAVGIALLLRVNDAAAVMSEELSYHGYFRGSMGTSDQGATQAKFQAPGARAKYRLGNEPDFNAELQLNYRHSLPKVESSDSSIQSVFMFDGFKNEGETSDFTVGHIAQVYFVYEGLLPREAQLWIGRRYYQRKSIHIMNHFWLNPGQNSHAALGLENFRLGSSQLDLAVFRNEDRFTVSNSDYLINNTVLDIRLKQLNLSSSLNGTLWGQVAARHPMEGLNYGGKWGQALGGWLDYRFSRFKGTAAALYQTGASITQSDFNPNSVREDQGWDLERARAVEINHVLDYEATPIWSFQWALLYREEERGTPGESRLTWISSGIRPVIYFTRHLNLAVEVGTDWIDDRVNHRKGQLNKFTVALQLAADRGFRSRPVLRFFITSAGWSDSFRGLVGTNPGNAPYALRTDGWTIGAQTEAWW
ncbi:MAG: carbohydrate porin [Gammaproteobacteria bacterium]|nr:carbohydrate porin [Gammaproteobacteria bacterium]MDH5692403.1 carbohydrate porin [Gammaproteobacteria bacterium]